MSIKKLAGQTLWYGVPSIATRFLGYILSFSLIYLCQPVNIADITQVYAIFPFLNILFTIRTNEAQTTVALPSFTLDWVSDINVYPNRGIIAVTRSISCLY